jgi:hypothetical protein
MHAILWKLSSVVLLLGNSLDSASSYGHREANPLLATSGRFGARGVVIKSVAVGGIILLLRKQKKVGTAVNFAAGGVFAGVAVRNWRMK